MLIFFLHSDPCFQPIGITNGLVIDKRAVANSRLSGNCIDTDLVWGEFHTSMTIKGIALKSTFTSSVELPMDYAYIDANPWMRLRQSLRVHAKERVNIVFTFFNQEKISYIRGCRQIISINEPD